MLAPKFAQKTFFYKDNMSNNNILDADEDFKTVSSNSNDPFDIQLEKVEAVIMSTCIKEEINF